MAYSQSDINDEQQQDHRHHYCQVHKWQEHDCIDLAYRPVSRYKTEVITPFELLSLSFLAIEKAVKLREWDSHFLSDV